MEFIDEISNAGLKFSLEFGQNWLKPINARLFEKYPDLNETELKEYNNLCEKVNKTGKDFVCENPVKIKDKVEFIGIEEFGRFMLDKFGWINKENLSRLYSQSCYYALK